MLRLTCKKYERVFTNQFHPLAAKKNVSFQDLKGMRFVVIDNIGIWKNKSKRYISEVKFFYQDSFEALVEIVNNSAFYYFTTNLTPQNEILRNPNNDRVRIPISDEEASLPFYANYLLSEKKAPDSSHQIIVCAVAKLIKKDSPLANPFLLVF